MENSMATAHTVINNYTRKGFKMLGHGCYAAVFESNTDPNLVYKVGARVTDPFLAYIQEPSLINNPHFPRIYEIFTDETWYLVKMERLEPTPSHKIEMSSELSSVVRGTSNTLQHLKPSHELYSIAHQIRELADRLDAKLDLHQGNVMMRGTTPVITDPLCDHNIYSEWALENWFGQQRNKEQRNASWSY